jgi:hypothetical protein
MQRHKIYARVGNRRQQPTGSHRASLRVRACRGARGLDRNGPARRPSRARPPGCGRDGFHLGDTVRSPLAPEHVCHDAPGAAAEAEGRTNSCAARETPATANTPAGAGPRLSGATRDAAHAARHPAGTAPGPAGAATTPPDARRASGVPIVSEPHLKLIAARRHAEQLSRLAESSAERAAPSCLDVSGEQNHLRRQAARADQRAAVAEAMARRVPRWR